jgi:hypothetical protein
MAPNRIVPVLVYHFDDGRPRPSIVFRPANQLDGSRDGFADPFAIVALLHRERLSWAWLVRWRIVCYGYGLAVLRKISGWQFNQGCFSKSIVKRWRNR